MRAINKKMKGPTMTLFEMGTCSRCGGTGKYSWNAKHGTMCFKCLGKGKIYTKNGQAALEFYQKSLMKNIEDVEVGNFMWEKGGWQEITKISKIEEIDNGWHFEFKNCRGFKIGFSGSPKIKVVVNENERKELIKKAIEYQNSLTK
jgi:hypothetical protein